MLVSLGAEQKASLPEGEDSLLEAEEEVPSAVEAVEAEGSVKIKKSTIKVDFFGAPGGIRTPDLEVRSLAFYPAKLRAHYLIYYTVNFGIFQVYLEKIPKLF